MCSIGVCLEQALSIARFPRAFARSLSAGGDAALYVKAATLYGGWLGPRRFRLRGFRGLFARSLSAGGDAALYVKAATLYDPFLGVSQSHTHSLYRQAASCPKILSRPMHSRLSGLWRKYEGECLAGDRRRRRVGRTPSALVRRQVVKGRQAAEARERFGRRAG